MMNKFKQVFTIFFQIGFSGTALFVIYFLFALGNYKGGFDGMVSLLLSQIILGSILTGATIAGCLILGLPVRLYSRLNTWWRNKQIWHLAGLFMGFILLALSIVNYWGIEVVRDNPNGEYYKPVSTFYMTITIVGWFMTAFFALHTYPGAIIKKVSVWLGYKRR